MNESIQNNNNRGKNPNENIFREVTMTILFAAIIVFSVLVFAGVYKV
jgi:hypothetical protein